MKFSKIKEKSEKTGKAPANTRIKKSKYTNPLYALELIGLICTQKSEDEIDLSKLFQDYVSNAKRILETIDRTIEQGIKSSTENEFDKWKGYKDAAEEFRFIESLPEIIIRFIENQTNPSIKVGVVGKFSSGKSTFINALSGAGAFLPADVHPTSIVNTVISFSTEANEMTVVGKNFAGQLIKLSPEVLECIQHSNNSTGHISSVLSKLIVDLPVDSSNILRHFTFYDTPGYSNSSNSLYNDSNKYLEIIQDCSAVIYCHNIDKPAIERDDLQVLKSIRDKKPNCPICVVFTRGHRQGNPSVLKSIIENAKETLRKNNLVSNISISVVDSDVAGGMVNFIQGGTSSDNLLKSIIDRCSNEPEAFERVTTVFEYLFDDMLDKTVQLHESYTSILRDFKRKLIYDAPYEIDNLRNARLSVSTPQTKAFLNRLLDKEENESINREKVLKKIVDSLQDIRNMLGREKSNLKYLLRQNKETAENVKHKFSSVASVISDRKIATDIFMSIALGDMLSFLECFSNKEGVDLTAVDNNGFNVVTRVAESGNMEMMKFLIENKANIDIKDRYGRRAIDVAVENHDRTMTAMLFKFNPDLRREKESLIQRAAKTNFEDFIKTL